MDFRQSLLHVPTEGGCRRTDTVALFNGKVLELCRKPPSDFLLDTVGISKEGSVIDIPQLLQEIEETDRRRKNRAHIAELSKEGVIPSISISDTIWTEKYRPRSYLQMCTAGNDKALRQMMHWLTLFRVSDDDKPEPDIPDRVHKKILLVHGPAGIGKTTAAHALPRQARYNVVELNAATSFDSIPGVSVAATIRLRIVNALTMNQINTSTNKNNRNMMTTRPTCLVIDELDTSIHSNEIVRVLEQLSKGTVLGNGKSKRKFVLNRPVICIANDLYANNNGPTFSSSTGRRFGSPMERLRPLCETVAFKRPMIAKSGTAIKTLKDHLTHIASQEHLEVSSRDVSDIVSICDGDIRACINHLQFHGGSGGNTSSNSSSTIDSVPHWFHVVDDTFKRDPKVTRAVNFNRMLQFYTTGSGRASVGAAHGKIIRGCFQRYLEAVSVDEDTIVKPARLSEWLEFYDCYLNSSTAQIMLSDSYVSIVWLKLWSLFNTSAKLNGDAIASSRTTDFACSEDARRNNAIITSVREQIPLGVRLAIGSEPWTAIVVPLLYQMVYLPGSERDTEQVSQAAQLVTALGFELSTRYDPDTGRDVTAMVPDLELVATFGVRSNPKRWLLSALARELAKRLTAEGAAAAAAVKEKTEVTHKRTSENGVPQPPKRQRVEMFGLNNNRPVANSTKGSFKPARTWVKYHEGFSNAVRKNIGWEELWK